MISLLQIAKALGNSHKNANKPLMRTNHVVVQRYEAQYEELLPDCPPMPGADDLIHHLDAHSVPMAICSSSGATEFRIKTRKRFQHWLRMIPLQVLTATDDEVRRGKPFPDPYLITMSRFRVSAGRCGVGAGSR